MKNKTQNNETVKMAKYYDRENQFTYDEKAVIGFKSDNHCAHCGKMVFVGYGATVDHFIPLNKGGSNRSINLITLCKACNEEKDDKLYSIDYVPYLKDKYKEELSKYLESYIQVTDYVQRNRLLAYDSYEDYILVTPQNAVSRRGKPIQGIKCPYTLKLATWNDLDRLHEYLIKYLKKMKSLDSEKAARENIIFWLQFGSIYYVERNGEIATMFAITIKQHGDGDDFRGIIHQPYMYIFSYYTTDFAYNIVKNTMINIPRYIIEENNLDFVPLNVEFLKGDNMMLLIADKFGITAYDDTVGGFCVLPMVIGDTAHNENVHIESDEMSEAEKKTSAFLDKFSDIKDQLIHYFSTYADSRDISWMINGLLPYEEIVDSELEQYMKFAPAPEEDEE